MPWWAWTLAGLGSAYGWRWAFRWMIDSIRDEQPAVPLAGDDIAVVALFAVGFPILMVGVTVVTAGRWLIGDRSWEQVAVVIGGESRARKRERREQALRDREQRVADLERELGIR